MDASRETMPPRYNSTDANVNSETGRTRGTCTSSGQTGYQTGYQHREGKKHGTLIPARSYLQLVHADYGKPSFLQRSVTRSINHSPGQAPCPGVED